MEDNYTLLDAMEAVDEYLLEKCCGGRGCAEEDCDRDDDDEVEEATKDEADKAFVKGREKRQERFWNNDKAIDAVKKLKSYKRQNAMEPTGTKGYKGTWHTDSVAPGGYMNASKFDHPGKEKVYRKTVRKAFSDKYHVKDANAERSSKSRPEKMYFHFDKEGYGKVENKQRAEGDALTRKLDKRIEKIGKKEDELYRKHPTKTAEIMNSASKAKDRAREDYYAKRHQSKVKEDIAMDLMRKAKKGKASQKTKDTLNRIYGTKLESAEDLDALRLQVYEAFEEGVIDVEERAAMLDLLDIENYE